MNRLKELREEAWSYAKEQKSENYQTLLGFFEDKFAELILREFAHDCLDITGGNERILMVAKKWNVEL